MKYCNNIKQIILYKILFFKQEKRMVIHAIYYLNLPHNLGKIILETYSIFGKVTKYIIIS